MYHKKFTPLWLLILCATFSSNFLNAQNGPSFTANDQVIPNEGYFEYGTNLGYYFGWQDYQLGDLAIGNPITNMEGIGATALRPGLFEYYLEEFGYNVNIPAYVHYENLGLKNHTLFIGYASDQHRDPTFNCPSHFDKTRVFKNLYTPIWDNGENGTPVNDENYYALFLYKMVQLYGPYIQYWEIWNEPDLDFNPNGIGWRPSGDPAGNWWDEDPEECDMQWGAPIEHYNRLMRISWEVIKTYDPDSYICVGGLGFPSFLDAMMRNTDNPVDGSITPEYPNLGGAYFDVLSFHSYPHINGSLQEYDPVSNQVIQKRNTDTAVRGIVEDLNDFKSVMANYGYDGVTYPEKETIMTESALPRLKLFDYIGSEAAASNYLIKLPIYLQKENVRQFHVYDLGEKKDSADAMYPFDVTGLYENPVGKDFSTIKRTNQGIAYKTVSNLLYEKTYDATQTAAMNLPVDTDGAAFLDANGDYTYVLWAITQLDDSEDANAIYSFPSSFSLGTMEVMSWDFALTGQTTFTNGSNIALTGAPIFLLESSVELTLACPVDITAEVDEVTNDVSINWFAPTYSSLCDSATVVISQTAGPANGSLFTIGTYTVTYEATDTCGNSAICSFDITVTDPPPPPPLDCPTGDHKFTLNVIGNGSVDVEYRDPLDATINYPTGTHITCMVDDQLLRLIPIPGQGETFDGWTSGGCTGTTACWKSISWETEITAVFTSVNASTAPTISATTTDVSCFLGDDGSITTSAQNGTPGYTYLWNTGATTANLNNLIAGTYTVTVTDSEAETASISKTITQPSNLIGLIASKNDLDCATVQDGFVSATAVGGTSPYAYSWSNGASTATIIDLPVGTYTVTVTDANNCQTTVEQELTANTLASPMANFSKNSNGLVVDFTDLSTGMPMSWNWDFGDGNISNIASPTHTYANAGTYTVCLIVENDCGLNAFCQDVTTLSISTTTTDVLCFGDSTGSIVTNTIAGSSYSYLWNTGDTTANLNNLIAGTYTVTITNAAGESANISATINEPTLVVGSISSQTLVDCVGGADGTATAAGSGGTSPYTYAWSNGETTATISNLSADTYTVIVTDTNGCTSSAEAIVLDGNGLSPFADFNPITTGLSVTFDDLSVGPPTSWAWDFGDGNTSNIASPTHVYTANSTYNVCLTVSNNCGIDTFCQLVTTLEVSLLGTDVLCNGDNTGSITTTTSVGQTYTYLWNTDDTTANLNNIIAGTYTVTITNTQGDTLSISETVNEPAILDVNIISQTDATCFGGDDGTITIEGIGGTSPYTYDWTGGRSGPAITDLTQGIYTVTITDANNCSTTQGVFVDMGTTMSPTALFSNSADGLTVDFIDLSTDVPTSYSWDFGDGNTSNIASPSHTYATNDTYNVCLTVSNNCGIDTFCQLVSTLEVSLFGTDILCNGDNTGSITTNTAAGQTYTYLWNTGDTTANLNNLIAGTYTVTITNTQGDTLSISETVNEPAILDINIISQTDATCFGGDDGAITIEGIGGTSPYIYDWTGGHSGPTITDLTQGIYTVTITDANSCSITQGIFVDMGTTMSPTAFFSNSAVGLTVNFIDLSTGTPTNYSWDFGDGNTSNTTTPTHTYDTIGVYNVCLIVDNICGQDTFCQNLSIGLDNNVFMSLGSAAGNLGDTIQIPFYVEGFENVITFQHSVSILDTSIASFVGISNFDTSLMNINPTVTNVNPDFVSVSWVNNSAPLTILDSSALYYLDVIIKGQPNECVDIVIDGAVTPIEFIMLDSTGIIIGSYSASVGEVCSAPGMIIDGLIARADGMEIENVDIHVNGIPTTISSVSGNYTLPPYPTSQTVVIEPHKDVNHVNGVTSYDLAIMQQHIVGTFPITSPYKLIAADVNNSDNISSFDLFLAQQVIVGNASSFPDNESWRFVPTTHVFADPLDPWAGGFPESISVAGMTGNVSNQDFVAIKVGDVTDSANPNLQSGSNESESRSSIGSIEFFIDKKINTVEGNSFIEFTAKDFTNISAFEFDLLFEKNNIQFERIESDHLNLIHGTNLLEEGILSIIWFDKTGNIEGQTFDDETVLFKIYFEDLANTTELPTELLQIDNSIRHSNAYTYTGSPREIQLTSLLTEHSENHLATEFHISPNQPNPFTEKTTMAFHLPVEDQTQIDVFDTNGKLVYHLEQFFQKGKNVVTIDSNNLPHYGIYIVRIKTNTQEGTSKIVFVK